MAPPRGKLIVIEGLDRAGKSTQVERLLTHLTSNGHKVEKIRFPDRSTPIGKSIDAYLRGESTINDHVIHLLFSANRWEAAEQITTKLQAGITLIIDRYSFSGAVYSAAKHNPLLDLSWAWNMEIGLPRPDLVLFLTISPQIQATRGGFGEERYESDLIQTAVRGCFERLWKRYDGNVQNIDAEGTLDEVETRISGAVRLVLTSPDSSLKTLRSLRNE